MRRNLTQANVWEAISEMAPRGARRPYAKRRRGIQSLIRAAQSLDLPKVTRQSAGGAKWAQLRASMLQEFGPVCMGCRRTMPDESLVHLHHIVPRSCGGKHERENAALLCGSCHNTAHWLYRTRSAQPHTLDELLVLLAGHTA